MTHQGRILEHLKKYGSITSLVIARKYNITTPHGVIRDLRKALGYDAISDIWCKKKKTVVENGKKKQVTTRYKRYFLKKMA